MEFEVRNNEIVAVSVSMDEYREMAEMAADAEGAGISMLDFSDNFKITGDYEEPLGCERGCGSQTCSCLMATEDPEVNDQVIVEPCTEDELTTAEFLDVLRTILDDPEPTKAERDEIITSAFLDIFRALGASEEELEEAGSRITNAVASNADTYGDTCRILGVLGSDGVISGYMESQCIGVEAEAVEPEKFRECQGEDYCVCDADDTATVSYIILEVQGSVALFSRYLDHLVIRECEDVEDALNFIRDDGFDNREIILRIDRPEDVEFFSDVPECVSAEAVLIPWYQNHGDKDSKKCL